MMIVSIPLIMTTTPDKHSLQLTTYLRVGALAALISATITPLFFLLESILFSFIALPINLAILLISAAAIHRSRRPTVGTIVFIALSILLLAASLAAGPHWALWGPPPYTEAHVAAFIFTDLYFAVTAACQLIAIALHRRWNRNRYGYGTPPELPKPSIPNMPDPSEGKFQL